MAAPRLSLMLSTFLAASCDQIIAFSRGEVAEVISDDVNRPAGCPALNALGHVAGAAFIDAPPREQQLPVVVASSLEPRFPAFVCPGSGDVELIPGGRASVQRSPVSLLLLPPNR